jgi:nucleotide-binding universal stress UspA family protein
MADIQQILVPVDFSAPSEGALDYAAKFATILGASVDVLHVWEVPGFVPPMSMVIEGMSLLDWAQKNAQEGLDRVVRAAATRGVAIRSARAEPGRPASIIPEVAKTGGYDLIVLGTHGRTGLSRMLLGSVAENVVRHAHCPVLTVRPAPAVEKAR